MMGRFTLQGKLAFTRSPRFRIKPRPRRQTPPMAERSHTQDSIGSLAAPMLPPVRRGPFIKPPKKEVPSLSSARSSLSSDSSIDQPLATQQQVPKPKFILKGPKAKQPAS